MTTESCMAVLAGRQERCITVRVGLIRTEREKESSGLPDLPNSGRLVELEYAVIEDRKVRSQLRNVSAIEQQARSQDRALQRVLHSLTF